MIDENKLLEDLEKVKNLYQNSKDVDAYEYNISMKTLDAMSILIKNQPKFENLFPKTEKLYAEFDEETEKKLKEMVEESKKDYKKCAEFYNEYTLEILRKQFNEKNKIFSQTKNLKRNKHIKAGKYE